jgi:hypothetical protein
METVILRVLLLIVLFVLLTGDYTTFFNQILPQSAKSVPTTRDASKTATKSYDEDGAQLNDALDIYCEYSYLNNGVPKSGV